MIIVQSHVLYKSTYILNANVYYIDYTFYFALLIFTQIYIQIINWNNFMRQFEELGIFARAQLAYKMFTCMRNCIPISFDHHHELLFVLRTYTHTQTYLNVYYIDKIVS